MINMTASEKAYFESGGAVHPETGKPAKEAPVEQETPKADEAPEQEAEAEEAKPETEPEADAPADDDESEEIVDVANQDGETRRKMIAFGAYEKQRKQARAAKEQLNQMQQQLAYLTGALQQRGDGQAPQQQTATEQPLEIAPPDYTKEPQKWLDWVNSALSKTAKMSQQQVQASQQTQQFQELNNAVMAAEQDFVSGDDPHPDFYDAVKFVRSRHTAELKEAGYDAGEIQQILNARAQDLAIRALRAGKSPAERLYAVARQHGYRKAAPAKPQESEAEKISRQAKGQDKASSISNLAGSGSKGLSIETLANVSQAEFNKMFKDGKVQEIMGIPT
jgi:hypothetical protein